MLICYFYKLSVQVLGASWYLLAIMRQQSCWAKECEKEADPTHFPLCHPSFLDCSSLGDPNRQVWMNFTHVLANCQPENDIGFVYGMYSDAFTNEVSSSTFLEKYFYCLWWGLKSLRYGLLEIICFILIELIHLFLYFCLSCILKKLSYRLDTQE